MPGDLTCTPGDKEGNTGRSSLREKAAFERLCTSCMVKDGARHNAQVPASPIHSQAIQVSAHWTDIPGGRVVTSLARKGIPPRALSMSGRHRLKGSTPSTEMGGNRVLVGRLLRDCGDLNIK